MHGVAIRSSIGLGLALGGAGGFGPGILLDDQILTLERLADVKHPKQIDRAAFYFEYPGNWNVNGHDSEYNPDLHFVVDSKAETSRFDGEPSQEAFETWGPLRGTGVALRGRRGVLLRYQVRIFAKTGKTKALVPWEFIDSDERRKVTPGFEQIRKSFRFKD